MPYFQTVPEIRQTQEVTSVFLGYNRNPEIGEGKNNGLEFYDMENLTSQFFPMLANRGKRGTAPQELEYPGGMIAKEKLAYVDNGTLYYDGSPVSGIELSPGEKQLVSMGAYLIIWPDKVYLNTQQRNAAGEFTDYGSVDNRVETIATVGNVTYNLCDADAKDIENIATTQPENPTAGQYWLDSSTTPHSLKRYSAATSAWVTIPTVYTKIGASGIGNGFEPYDGVTISGITYSGQETDVQEQYEALNGEKTIQARDENYIVIVGLIDKSSTQSTGTVTVERKAPDMDYLTEAGNRLWGCKYGETDGKAVNEIYACALGDFKNWKKFQGISTDSYAASVGTDGKWTGAITYLGYPLFFKENVLHKVFISSTGAHQIRDSACRGVQDGCSRSLAIVGERLYYKARAGIMMYDGSLPECVSDALGTVQYSDAAAGGIDDKYYVSMKDSAEAWHMFVFDTAKGLWHREDATKAIAFARYANNLYYIDAVKNKIMTIRGTEEGTIHWSATTGIIGYTTVEQKYVSRFNLRMMLPKGSGADLYIQYDSDGVWHHCGHMQGMGTNSFMLPVRPRRCDHFSFRIEGTGDIRVYSMAKIFEEGSDVL